MTEQLKGLIVKVRDAQFQVDCARSAFYRKEMDWQTLNGYIVAHRKLDRELRAMTRRFHSQTERELKAKYVTGKQSA